MPRACLPFDSNPRPPRIRLPAGAIDCHAHIFGPIANYPFCADRSFTPPEALVEDYMRVLDILGFARGVIVHGSAHGTDNRASAAAIAAAPERFRGVAVVDASFDESAIAQLHQLGFRGARMSTVVRGGPGFSDLETIAAHVKPFGWHLVVHVNQSAELVALAPRLLATGLPIVVDHLARIRPEEGTSAPAFAALREILASDRGWVKLSGLHRLSREPWPWRDMTPLVEAVLSERPDRALWGTDWPHPNHFDWMPNDGDLVDAFAQWVPDEAIRRRVLSQNPAVLYDFR